MRSERQVRRAHPVRRRKLPRAVYVRRRFAVAFAIAVAVGAASAAAAAASAPPQPGPEVVVAPEETLWALALRDAPAGESPRRWVFEVERINHLDGPEVVAGQEIRLPR